MEDQRRQQILDACEGASYNELVEMMLAAQEAHAKTKALAADYWQEVCLITRQIIPERMDTDQIQNVTVILPDGSKKQLLCLDQVSVKTPAENKAALWDWLRDNGAEELITETVNSSSLAGYVREQMRQGEPWPSDICEVSTYTTASLRKA
jgi:hypothetical protein